MPRAAEQLKDILQGIEGALAEFETQRKKVLRIGKRLRKSVDSISAADTRREIKAELEELSKVLNEVFMADRIRW